MTPSSRVHHSGASFEARVLPNNPDATDRTAFAPRNGYAGSFHISGHCGSSGDVGQCEVRGLPRPNDPRPAHSLTPARKVVIATDAISRAIGQGKSVTVTVVPILTSATARCDTGDVLKFGRVSIVAYR